MKKNHNSVISKRKLMLFLVVSIIPMLIWTVANYFMARNSYEELALSLVQNKRSQFIRYVKFLENSFAKLPRDFTYEDYLDFKTDMVFYSRVIHLAIYANIDNRKETYQWTNYREFPPSKPLFFNPANNYMTFVAIHGTDTVMVEYSIADLLKISGISLKNQPFRERVMFFEPNGNPKNITGYPAIDLAYDRLIPDERGIFASSNYIGWYYDFITPYTKTLGGKLIVAFDKSDILNDWYSYKNFFPLSIALLIVFLALIYYYFGINITRGLKQLIKITKSMGEGNFDNKVQVDSSKEIEELAASIEEMRIKLKSTYEDLEITVNKRTRDLQEAQFQVMHQEKMASIGLLAAGIAHEIGNPLTSISSMVQLMKRKVDDPGLLSYLDTIYQNMERITKIVRELVDFSRPSRSELVLTNVTKTVEAAVGIIKYDRRARDIEIVMNLDPNLPEILIVEDQLMQVFVNILVNAIDAIKKEPKRIEVRSYYNDEFIFIEFKDSGIGISPKLQKRIFEPFFTTKDVGKGTGLGLSVSYGIVKNFGGTISVESVPGVSTSFTIVLPIRKGNDNIPELLKKKLKE